MLEVELQKSLFELLSGDAGIQALGVTVVDVGRSEEDASGIYPYLICGDITLTERDTDRINGFTAAVRLHSWTNDGTLATCKRIQGTVYALLHHQQITVQGYSVFLTRREDSEAMQAPSGAMHGVCDYIMLIEES